MITEKIQKLIESEKERQISTLQLIPSENFCPKEVRNAVGSMLCNKYSEGYPNKRYYQGNEFIDQIELATIEKAKKLFDVEYVNVQPYSGSPANSAVYFGLLEKGDTIIGMDLPSGGHLSHGHSNITFAGKYFNSIQYSTDPEGFIDYEKIRQLALEHKPKLIICGHSAYPRKINFEKFGKIADEIGAYLLADISHIAGLVVTNNHPSPTPYAHIITTTTHKTLRGPRGALIMVTKKGIFKDSELPKKIDRSVFPGLQGGPHNNSIAGIGIALELASKTEFKKYADQIIRNTKALENALKNKDFNLITDGTDNHLILINLANKDINGWYAAWGLEMAGIIVNRNAIPHDPLPPFYPSGIRLGTPAITSMGMVEKDMEKIANWIDQTLNICIKLTPTKNTKENRQKYLETIRNDENLRKIRQEVKRFCIKFNVSEL